MSPTWLLPSLLPEWSQNIVCSLPPVPLPGALSLWLLGFTGETSWPKPDIGCVGPWGIPEGRAHGPTPDRSSRCHCGHLPTMCLCQNTQSLWPVPPLHHQNANSGSLLSCRGAWTLHPQADGLLGPWEFKVFPVCIGFPLGFLELFGFTLPHKESYSGRFLPCLVCAAPCIASSI